MSDLTPGDYPPPTQPEDPRAVKVIADLQSRLTAAETRIKELGKLAKGALSFGVHHFSCDIQKGTVKDRLRCTCGLDNLRAELDKLKGSK